VLLQERYEFLLKTAPSMMFLLTGNVGDRGFGLRYANRKGSVPFLPREGSSARNPPASISTKPP